MTQTTLSDSFPKWTIIGLLPHGTAALYLPNSISTEVVIEQLRVCIKTAGKFLGYRALAGEVIVIDEVHDEADLAQLLSSRVCRLLVIYPLSNFKVNKYTLASTTHIEYFILNRLAQRFKVTILVAPEKRSDAVDFAVDTLITFMIPASADDNAPYRFKVEARDLPLIRGNATFNPASGTLEVAK